MDKIMRIKSFVIIAFCFSLILGSDNRELMVEDTMILRGKDALLEKPQFDAHHIATFKANSIVYILDKKPVPNELKQNAKDFFLKVKTPAGQIGYFWTKSLITKKQFQLHQDSLNSWAKLPQPLYGDLIGTTYLKNSELPAELYSGEFVSVGEKNLYGIISVSNKYNGDYAYLFFVIEDKTKGDGLRILDIIPLYPALFSKGSSLWFKQCECKNKATDCSDVVAIYYHEDKMAKKNIMVKPDKAWRPNYKTQKLEAIPPELVKCGSMASEEDAGGP